MLGNQCSCADVAAFGAFLENLNWVSCMCAFHYFRPAAQRGWGFDAEQGVFSASPACLRLCWCAALECGRSVRVCAASTKIRVRDG